MEPQLKGLLLAATNPDYVVSQIFPELNVVEKTAKIRGVSKDHFRKVMSNRSLTNLSRNYIEFNYTDAGSYNVEDHDLSLPVTDLEQENAQDPIDLLRDASIVLKETILLAREVETAANLTDTGVMTNNVALSGSSQFSDYVNSKPDEVFRAANDAVKTKIARKPNSLLIEERVWDTLKLHPLFLSQISGITILGDDMMKEIMKTLFGYRNIYVAKAMYNSAKPGQTDVLAPIWDKVCLPFYRADAPGIMQTSLGYSFRRSSKKLRTEITRHPDNRGDVVDVFDSWDDMVTDAGAGYLITGAIA